MWITDPKAKEPSVTLTLTMYSLVLLSLAGALQVAKVVENTGPFLEIFITCFFAYVGRRNLNFNIGGKSFTSDNPESK